MSARRAERDPMTLSLARFRDPEALAFADAWVGLEPTFQSAKSVRKWAKATAKAGGEDAYFNSRTMLRTQKKIARRIKKRYETDRKQGLPCAMFARVELDEDLDQWRVRRQNLLFHWEDAALEPFEVRVSLDPETFEYSIKPVPLMWLFDDRFVDFLQRYVWDVPEGLGLSGAIAHGGGQFSFSAKTFLAGSLLADDIACKLSHPELSTWIMDWPNPDDRCFRATKQRLSAFRTILDDYWAGAFHPRVLGSLSAENAYLDRGFGPACRRIKGLMDPKSGPVGDAREVFQNNFAFGRAVRLLAQNVHPGYWQSAHPDEDGYRPDQIMRYSEGNLNRLQIVGELHVKSGKTLEADRAPELEAPLEAAFLTTEASWENRGQMSRTSARDFVEAVLLDANHARHLQAHPHAPAARSLLQDQLLGDAEETLRKHGARNRLETLHAEARKLNLEASRGRMKTDWIEPETLFWEAWKILPIGEKAAIAREAIDGFVERVEQAAAEDPRPGAEAKDPMEWHRHRIHPELWHALEESTEVSAGVAARELKAWQERRDELLKRRPVFSQNPDLTPPWA